MKLDVPSFVSWPISSGTVPFRLLSRNDTIDKSVSKPICVDIDPVKELLSPTKYVKYFSLYNVSGKVPLKLLF